MVNKITTPPTTSELIGTVNEIIDDKQDTLVSGTNIKTINNQSLLGSGNIDIQGGSAPEWGNIGGDITAQTDLQNALEGKQDVISDLLTIRNGATLGATAVQPAELNGYATENWVSAQGYITNITSGDVTTALGYTPYNASNPSGYITNSALDPYALSADLATVATSGSYNDLSNKPTIPATQVNSDWNATSGVARILNKPTIPTVNNPTITFTQGGTTKGTITLNQLGDQTIAFDASGNARNIGEIIQSSIPLTDTGLHLLDGSLIQGNGIYSEFVDYMVQKSKKFNPSPFSFSGTASVNSNGITSYLSYDNRCTVSVNNVTPTNNIIFNFSGILKSNSIRYADMWGGFEISRSGPFNPTLRISYRYTTYLTITEDEISTYNDNFTDIKIELTATKIKVTIKNNGNTFTKEADVSVSFGTITGIGFPGGDSGSFVANLKNCSLIVDDTEIFSGSTQQDYFTDETSWQNSVNTYGVCGKFVYDSVNNTIRLPKITGFTEGTTDVTALGDLIEAGLPDFDAVFVNHARDYSPARDKSLTPVSGAIAVKSDMYPKSSYPNVGSSSAGGYNYDQTVEIRPSISNSIYGNSSTVQPQSIKVLYYIVVANSVKTDIQVDIDEIATDLNGKVDKADLQEVQCVVETYQNGTSWYRVYSDGWCEQGGFIQANNSWQTCTLLKPFVNTNYNIYVSGSGTTAGQGNAPCYVNNSNKTINSFQYTSVNVVKNVYWQACGYIS